MSQPVLGSADAHPAAPAGPAWWRLTVIRSSRRAPHRQPRAWWCALITRPRPRRCTGRWSCWCRRCPPARSTCLPSVASWSVPAPHRRGRPTPDGRTADRVDSSHPYVHFDPDLCISCGRCVRMCDEVQGTYALTLAGRGPDTVLVAGAATAGSTRPASAAAAVSTRALQVLSSSRFARSAPDRDDHPHHLRLLRRRLQPRRTRTRRRGGRVTPALDGPVNRGHARVKGRFAHAFARSRDRLTSPLVRRDGRLQPATG